MHGINSKGTWPGTNWLRLNGSQVLDGPDAARQLTKAKGVGPRSAAKFKQFWDAKRGGFAGIIT